VHEEPQLLFTDEKVVDMGGGDGGFFDHSFFMVFVLCTGDIGKCRLRFFRLDYIFLNISFYLKIADENSDYYFIV